MGGCLRRLFRKSTPDAQPPPSQPPELPPRTNSYSDQSRSKKIFRTIINSDQVYATETHQDVLFFEADDIIEVLREDGDWCYARRRKDKSEGSVPHSAMAEINDSDSDVFESEGDSFDSSGATHTHSKVNEAFEMESVGGKSALPNKIYTNTLERTERTPQSPTKVVTPTLKDLEGRKIPAVPKDDDDSARPHYLEPRRHDDIQVALESSLHNSSQCPPHRESSSTLQKKTLRQYDIQDLLRKGKNIVRALCDSDDIYIDAKNLNQNLVEFEKGDYMEVVQRDGDWSKAKHLTTGEIGDLPYKDIYITEERSLDSYEWFHGNLTRREARDVLLTNGNNQKGTFLIRNSESNIGSYALAVLDETKSVKHYSIYYADDNRCYIFERRMFDSIQQLVKDYSIPSNDLHFPLLHPCEKVRKSPTQPILPDHYEISSEHIRVTEKIGQGSFGEVWKGLWKDKLEVAVKVLRNDDIKERGNFINEAATMSQLNHKRLVKLYGVCSMGKQMKIVTELLEGGSLINFLRSSTTTLTSKFMLDIASQVADGMRYMEKRKFLHRDLAARNVLLDKNYREAKICDFGLARFMRGTSTKEQDVCMPLKWTALEGLLHGEYSTKSDVWGYGILLVELTNGGQSPYSDITNNMALRDLLETGYRHPKPSMCPTFLYDIMQTCWREDPSARPSFEEIFNLLKEARSTDSCNPKTSSAGVNSRDSGCVSGPSGNSSSTPQQTVPPTHSPPDPRVQTSPPPLPPRGTRD